jgi:hypothetical protein
MAMKHAVLLLMLAPAVAAVPLRAQQAPATRRAVVAPAPRESRGGDSGASLDELAVGAFAHERLQVDLSAVQSHRPAYAFWQYLFTVPDGRILLGSGKDGRLLALLPEHGDWARDTRWEDSSLQELVAGRELPDRLQDRRTELVRLLEPSTGPLIHNPARGNFLLPNIPRFGGFLGEWAAIYERFGVPGEIGLAQAILESGLDGRVRSRANALGFCQFLKRNWDHLNRLTPHTIEPFNQTTQAPYCAAYISVLATMYGSYIPALSEHHSGGANVGRVVINGERLGGTDAREQYLIGSDFTFKLRGIQSGGYRDIYRTYGPRSFRYAEMVFGNMLTVRRLTSQEPQTRIYAMRTSRAWPLDEITRRAGIPVDEVQRYNPAIVRQVPARSDLYLPSYVAAFGPNVSFWHRVAPPRYAALLNEFLHLEGGVQRWHEASFEAVLRGFEQRFRDTETDEGDVMASTLAYVIDDLRTSRRAAILEEFRTSGKILTLFNQGVKEVQAMLTAGSGA